MPRSRTPAPTLRSISIVTVAKLVAVIVVLGGVATGVTQYQRTLYGDSSAEVYEASRVLGEVDRALIESAGGMLEVLYRPRDGEGLDAAFAVYEESSERTAEAFDRASTVLGGTSAGDRLATARATWDEIDAVVLASPDEWTSEMIQAAVDANADPWVATVWAPYDRLNTEMADVRGATVDELQARSAEIGRLQSVLVPLVLVAIVVAVLLSVMTLRRLSRQVLTPLAHVEASARTLHAPTGYRASDVSGAVVEVQTLASTVDEAARTLHVHQEELREQALTDPLTGLPNREAFGRELRTRLGAGSGSDAVAVLFVDLDDFKHVNDTLGHAAGDALLREVADRLSAVVAAGGMTARLGGDEFAVVVGTDPQGTRAVELAERVQRELSTSVQLGSHRVPVGCSIGVVCSPAGESRDADSMLTNADFAMYMAKSRGKGRHEVYSVGVHTEMAARMELARELSEALPLDQFVLHYQPVLDSVDGRLLGLEALLRWVHPERGLIAPDDFIPLAEETGAIVEIGEWVLREACSALAQLLPFQPGLHIGVNVAPKQLEHVGFVDQVAEALRLHSLGYEHLVLEITEATAMTSTGPAVDTLAELRDRGVHVALDDFGTGFSSLRYLGELPADIIKMDRSFIADDFESTDVMLETVVQLAERLGLEVVVEGIETEADLRRVRRLGRVAVQGYLFARPMSLDRAMTFVRSRSGQPA